MRKLVSKLFYKIGALSFKTYALSRKIGDKTNPVEKTIRDVNNEKWYADKGDDTLRVEYTLNENSIVFDVGGYEGDWASEIAARYNCRVFIFEPVSIYYNKLVSRFRFNKKIKVFRFGLSNENKKLNFSVLDQSSSAFKKNADYETRDKGTEAVELRSFAEVCKENNVEHIDLIKINIEGGEYELLDQIISSGWIHKIKNIQVQFHDFVENSDTKMSKLKQELARTHALTYEYVYVWGNWKLKE